MVTCSLTADLEILYLPESHTFSTDQIKCLFKKHVMQKTELGFLETIGLN